MTDLARWTALGMDDSQHGRWQFIGQPWQQDDKQVVTPPPDLADWNLALWTAQAYRDFEATFEFRWDIVWTDAALLFRAADAQHYYMVHFPVSGQHYRAEHFWAAVSKVDASGYVQVLRMEMVHGVSSAPHRWHRVNVQMHGDEIRVRVNGRPMTTVCDATYGGPGLIGLASYSGEGASAKSSFRGLQVRGRALPAPPWDEALRPQRNWGIADPSHGSSCTNVARAGNGDLLAYSYNLKQIRSKDNGQTWAIDPIEFEVPDSNGYRLRLRADGRLDRYYQRTEKPFTITKQISDDHGLTWSKPKTVVTFDFPESQVEQFIGSSMLDTQAGSLLYFLATRRIPRDINTPERRYRAGKVPGEANYVLRSTDGGENWSAPIPIDNAEGLQGHWQIPSEASEVSSAQTRTGGIIALVRPHDSPVMWESWSYDDGLTWTSMARGPFAMYASTNSMVTTASGVILIGGRFPGMAVQASFDDGMTWRCYQVCNAMWANGSMFEIEPDVVLFVYGGLSEPHQLRYQVIKVTASGLEPGPVVRGIQPGEQ